MESFNEARFLEVLKQHHLEAPNSFVQDNHSCSGRGVLRGLHFQRAPHGQGKLVRVTQGAAYDVAVDLRKDSSTFGQWYGIELSALNKKMMWIPEGFAHGFLALENDTNFHYKTTSYYSKSSEGAVLWNDPDLAITWPDIAPLIISDKDQQAPRLVDVEGL